MSEDLKVVIGFFLVMVVFMLSLVIGGIFNDRYKSETENSIQMNVNEYLKSNPNPDPETLKLIRGETK